MTRHALAIPTGLLTATTIAAVASAPASAAGAAKPTPVAGGTTTITPSGAAYRALRRSGVSVETLGEAVRRGSAFGLTVAKGAVGDPKSYLQHAADDGLALERGDRVVRLTDLRLNVGGGSRVTGRIDGGARRTLFRLKDGRLHVAESGRVATSPRAHWRLSAGAAKRLRSRLDVRRLRSGTAFAFSSVAVGLAPSSAPGTVPTPAPGTAPSPSPGPAPAPAPIPGAPAVVSGTADWGVRESFRNYIRGSIANGKIEVSDGAAENADGTFRFGQAAGTADPASGAVDVRFRGTVYFEGHGDGEAAALRVWVSDPRIVAAAGSTTGELRATVSSKALSGPSAGQVVDYGEVVVGSLDLTQGTRTSTAAAVTWSGVPATLTEEGVPAFAGFYPAGSELDPVGFSIDLG